MDHGRRVYLCSHATAHRARCFLDFNLFLRCASQLKDDILQPQPHNPAQNQHFFRYRGRRGVGRRATSWWEIVSDERIGA
jgi:hypothetical protein